MRVFLLDGRIFRSFGAVAEQKLISIADYERAAAAQLGAAAFAYFAGGAGDEVTLRDNVAAWRRVAVRPRMLVGVGERDSSVTVLGRKRPHPVIVAPMALQRLGHPEGEVATARGAAATGAVMCLSTLGTTTVSALAEAVPNAPRWFQLYVLSDRGVTRELVAQASEHGYEALVVTVDLPVLGLRERELRTGVVAEAGLISGAAAAGVRGVLTPTQLAGLLDPDLSWKDLERFVADSSLPVLVKGILTAQDARLAAEHGARGVVVSNHGGRQLDTVLSGADALPEVVEAVGDRLDVLVDGGIRRGTDVLKALALGARAVMVGRPVLWGLAVDGAEGARAVLEILLSELDTALALAGAPMATCLDRTFLASVPR
jgi:4-hydroxymandelate oxidase